MTRETAKEVLKALKRILAAHQSGNNGAVMGEAVLCRYFEMMAEHVIRQAESEQ